MEGSGEFLLRNASQKDLIPDRLVGPGLDSSLSPSSAIRIATDEGIDIV